MTTGSLRLMVVAAWALLPVIPRSLAQLTLTNLGNCSAEGDVEAAGLSADGLAATGTCTNALGNRYAFRWMRPEGFRVIPVSVANPRIFAISGNGLAVVGYDPDDSGGRAFRWTAQGTDDLGMVTGGTDSVARGIAADGSVVVGHWSGPSGSRAFRWTASNGMQDLGPMPGGSSSYARGVSADGNVIVGYGGAPGGGVAFRWTSALGIQILGVAPGHSSSYGLAISADGLVIAGYGTTPAGGCAIRWTAAEGVQALPLPAGRSSARAEVINAHGTVIGGNSPPFLWTESLGAVDLTDYLLSRGMDVNGWVLTNVNGLSYDGAAILGTGVFGGRRRAWLVADLFCAADYNHDGFVDGIDYDRFTSDFESDQADVRMRADVNFDWVTDDSDLSTFLGNFESGC